MGVAPAILVGCRGLEGRKEFFGFFKFFSSRGVGGESMIPAVCSGLGGGFWGWAGGAGVCCFWPKLAVWAGSGMFWHFLARFRGFLPGLLCAVGVGDFFSDFLG